MTWPIPEKARCGEPFEWAPTAYCATPLPEVYEDNSEAAWLAWDAAVCTAESLKE